jgi:hypothetical protein
VLDQTAHNLVPTVYAAIDLSKKSWVVAIMTTWRERYRVDIFARAIRAKLLPAFEIPWQRVVDPLS